MSGQRTTERATVNHRLRSRRRELDLSQETVAAQIGLERSALAKIETGVRGISWAEGWALLDALDLRPEDLKP